VSVVFSILLGHGASAIPSSVSGMAPVHALFGGLGANAYTVALRSGGRMPFYVVEIATEKRCVHEWGVAPCPATGGSDGAYCYRSWQTCPTAATKAAFQGSAYTWRFISANVPLHELPGVMAAYSPYSSSQYPILPLVEKVDHAAAKVDLEAGFTQRGKLNITFHDLGSLHPNDVQAQPVPGFDRDKSIRNTSTAGFWWLRWLAMWPNYRNMAIRVLRGFVASDATLEECWSGLVEDISRDASGTIKLVATDFTEPMLKSIPHSAGNLNTLDADVSRSATSWVVQDAGRYTDPLPLAYGYVWAEAETTTGRTELVRISGRNTTTETLTVVRGRLGTYAEPVRADTTIREVIAFGPGDGITEGRPMSIIRALLERVGLGASRIDATSFDASARALGPVVLRRTIREPKPCNDLINDLCQPLMLCLYVGRTNKIEARVNMPARPGETVQTVTDARNILSGSGNTKTGERQRITHVNVYYDHDEEGEGEWPQDGGVAVFINAAAIAPAFHGADLTDVQSKSLDGRWLRGDDADTAAWIASAWGRQLGTAPMRFTWNAELRDATYGLGDLVDITSVDLLDAHGAKRTTRAMIVEVKPVGLSGFSFVAQTFGFFPTSQGGRRIALIAPSGQADYGSATTQEKNYWYIGTAATDSDSDGDTDTTTVGTAPDDGYYL
jgi:hypothetical protein